MKDKASVSFFGSDFCSKWRMYQYNSGLSFDDWLWGNVTYKIVWNEHV